jgi:hypothetical protein
MAKFFSRNIGLTGRLIRGALGLLLAVAALCCEAWWARVLFGVAAGFVCFEAARGWCVMRACGVKTRW